MADEEAGRYGMCQDCKEEVDVIVDAFQLTAADRFICVKCRGERMMTKARGSVAALEEKAEVARENANQKELALDA